MDDHQLIRLLQQQDEQAQRYFLNRFQEPVFRLALKLVLDTRDAEDATQESLMDALVHITDFHEDASLKTWVYRIATNRCLQLIRAKKRKKRFAVLRSLFISDDSDEPLPIEDTSSNINRIVESKELSEILKSSLKTLPESQRMAFSLVYLSELSYQETADVLETSVKAIEALLSRAKKKLQNQLKAKGYENEN